MTKGFSIKHRTLYSDLVTSSDHRIRVEERQTKQVVTSLLGAAMCSQHLAFEICASSIPHMACAGHYQLAQLGIKLRTFDWNQH